MSRAHPETRRLNNVRTTLFLLLLVALPCGAAGPLRVAVAANFRATLEAINAGYERDRGQRVVLSSASTGVLATQVLHGAPFDLFLAADSAAPGRVFDDHPARYPQPPTCYAVGRLALAGGAPTALANPHNSLAIANPETAPYGRAALEVLARPEFAAGAARKLVRGNNVVQALQFHASGAADLALLPRAIAPPGAADIPAAWHAPIEQHLLLLTDSPAARDYLAWLRSATVRSFITHAGYEPCP